MAIRCWTLSGWIGAGDSRMVDSGLVFRNWWIKASDSKLVTRSWWLKTSDSMLVNRTWWIILVYEHELLQVIITTANNGTCDLTLCGFNWRAASWRSGDQVDFDLLPFRLVKIHDIPVKRIRAARRRMCAMGRIWSESFKKASVGWSQSVRKRRSLRQFLVVNWEYLCSRISTCLSKSSTERLWSKTQATLYKTLDTSQLLRHTFELFPGSYGNAKSFSSKRFVWMARTWSYSVSVFSCRTRLSCSVSVFGFSIRFPYSPYSVVGGCERRGRNTAVVYQHSARQFNGYADQLQSKLEIKAFSESKQFYLGDRLELDEFGGVRRFTKTEPSRRRSEFVKFS